MLHFCGGGLDDGAAARVEFFARCGALEDLAYERDSGRTEYALAAGSASAHLCEVAGRRTGWQVIPLTTYDWERLLSAVVHPQPARSCVAT